MTGRDIPFWNAKRRLNPLDKLSFRLGFVPPGDALIETIGRRSGQPRATPVCHGLEDGSYWITAQHGRRANYVRSIEANRRVRVNNSHGWRTGTARIPDGDDPDERRRILGKGDRWRSLCLAASSAMSTNPPTNRIDLDPR